MSSSTVRIDMDKHCYLNNGYTYLLQEYNELKGGHFMQLKNIIDEIEYERLNMYKQMKYMYCQKCKFYYLASNKRSHLCIKGGENNAGTV